MEEKLYHSADKVASYYIHKKYIMSNIQGVERHIEDLITLQKVRNDFGEIQIPEFTFTSNGRTLEIVSQFIKGDQLLVGKAFIKYINMIQKYCVERDDIFTYRDISPSNFIIERDTNILYAVDLEGFGCEEHDIRMRKFKEKYVDCYIQS